MTDCPMQDEIEGLRVDLQDKARECEKLQEHCGEHGDLAVLLAEILAELDALYPDPARQHGHILKMSTMQRLQDVAYAVNRPAKPTTAGE